jgi:short-subunit dehydrogenase
MKSVFLTGGSSGIGAEFYCHLTNINYKVTAPTRAELDLANFNIESVDLSDYDYLLLCAGVDTNGRQAFISQSTADFVNTMNVNLIANMQLVHKYIQQRQGHWSKIIVIGSTITNYVWPNFVTYGTSKIALESFIDSVAKENTNVGTCIIRPGLTKTNFHINRGNVNIKDKNILYDTMPHVTTSELVPIFDQILNDQRHLIKTVEISA